MLFRAIYVYIRMYYEMLRGNIGYVYGIPLKLHRIFHKAELNMIKKYKSIHEGERCFIIGTGPSLTVEDVLLLKNKYTIGVNTLFKYFQKIDWRPTYYCIIDPGTFQNIKREFEVYKVKNVFFPCNRIDFDLPLGIPFELNCSDFYKLYAPKNFKFTKFSFNAEKYIYDGASVVYAAMQLAVYMGFSEIVLIGVDCNYGGSNVIHNKELSYSNYNYSWTKDTALTMIEGFKIAKEYTNRHGIKVYNATRGGMLEVFPRRKLEELI